MRWIWIFVTLSNLLVSNTDVSFHKTIRFISLSRSPNAGETHQAIAHLQSWTETIFTSATISRGTAKEFCKGFERQQFFFPALIEFAFEIPDYESKLSDSLKHFLQRHPMIEVLKYRVYTLKTSTRPLATPGILQKLRHLEGFVEDGILACNLGLSRLESLTLDRCLQLAVPCSERCAQIRDALSKMASIRRLYLREQEGYDLANISSIISSCLNLTHFECWFDRVSSKRCVCPVLMSPAYTSHA